MKHRMLKVGDHVMLYAKVTWVSKFDGFVHLMTDGGNHISESARNLYSPARPMKSAQKKKSRAGVER